MTVVLFLLEGLHGNIALARSNALEWMREVFLGPRRIRTGLSGWGSPCSKKCRLVASSMLSTACRPFCKVGYLF